MPLSRYMRDRKGGKGAAPVSVPYIEGGGLGGALEKDTEHQGREGRGGKGHYARRRERREGRVGKIKALHTQPVAGPSVAVGRYGNRQGGLRNDNDLCYSGYNWATVLDVQFTCTNRGSGESCTRVRGGKGKEGRPKE